jgi:hypothetical protein
LQGLPPYSDAGPAISALVGAGVAVGVLTNGGERAHRNSFQ